MVKYHYFESLEELSALAATAVSLACGTASVKEQSKLSDLRRSCDRLVCELEDALFSDFLPPLERDNLAACAHSLSRVAEQASELFCHGLHAPSALRHNEEGEICIKLSALLCDAVARLRRIRRPDEAPDVQGFRKLLSDGRSAHNTMLAKVHSGTLPRSAAQSIILTGRLRCELSRAFDELVEIMLNNI